MRVTPLVRTMGGGLVLLLLVACNHDRAHAIRTEPDSVRTLVNEHGIKVGDHVAPLSVACSDAHERIVGRGRQLITLTTLEDLCSDCHRHLGGLSRAVRALAEQRGDLGVEPIFLAAVPSSRQVEAIRAYRDQRGAALCFDEGSELWTRHHLTHTPVTLLLLDGRVAFAHDAPLDDEQARSAFVQSVVVSIPKQ
jgi:hypothetical protein